MRYKVGGSATINGIIMINSSNGRAVKAFREKDGSVSVMELPAYEKVMEFYRLKFERYISKLPAIRELFRLLLTLILSLVTMFIGIFRDFSFIRGWTVKKAVVLVVTAFAFYVILFMSDIYSFTTLIILVIIFHKKVNLILKYHGAEHKSINMYEGIDNPEDISVECSREYSRIHYRCGTNIIILFIPLSLLYYFFLEDILLSLSGGSILDLFAGFAVLGIAVELFKMFQKPIMRWILKPGLFIQKYITTKEPDDNQLEVALCALRAVIKD